MTLPDWPGAMGKALALRDCFGAYWNEHAKHKRAGELAFKGGGTDAAPRIGTPEPFRDMLIAMAHSAPAAGGGA